MKHITIINGPNLNMLGTREPEIYGKQTLADIQKQCEDKAKALSLSLDFYQSNHEGQLIDWIHAAASRSLGLIINPAGLGHTSIALMDALLTLTIPAIEVHLSNIYTREAFRHHTYTSHAVKGIVSGLGAQGYLLAMEALTAT